MVSEFDMQPQVSDDALKVLLALRESAAEGYGLMSKTQLSPDALIKALRELQNQGIIFVKGELEPARVGDAYASVRPSARGFADMIVQYKA